MENSANNSSIAINESTSRKRKDEDENELFNSQSSVKKPKSLITEEGYLFQFFNEALSFIQKTMKVSDDELRKAMVGVIGGFHFREGKSLSGINFNESETLCAYFYLYSPLSAQLSRNKISEALSNCEALELRFDSWITINVVSIGGGPGCDIVGMLSALRAFNLNCKKLNFVVIDKVKRWESFLNVEEFLLREGDFGDASRMFQETNAKISFVCEDVCKDDTPESAYYEVLQNSDVMLMKNILSILPSSLQISLAKSVVRHMKIGSVLLVIDSPYYDFEDFGLDKLYSSWKESDLEKMNPGFYVQGSGYSPLIESDDGEMNPGFLVQGSPIKNCGHGIARSSKAEIAVFLKTE